MAYPLLRSPVSPTLVNIANAPRTINSAKPILAFRTNLLYDLVGAFNLGIEIPVGRWSLLFDGAYSYWHTGNNLYALQTLEYGAEGRIWLGRKSCGRKLTGWNFGIYGRYWSRFDVQAVDGYQGDDVWSVGITAGYAVPLSSKLNFEASIGVGYFHASEFRHYHRPWYDAAGEVHLMWQQTGVYSVIAPTKFRLSLVYLLNWKNKG